MLLRSFILFICYLYAIYMLFIFVYTLSTLFQFTCNLSNFENKGFLSIHTIEIAKYYVTARVFCCCIDKFCLLVTCNRASIHQDRVMSSLYVYAQNAFVVIQGPKMRRFQEWIFNCIDLRLCQHSILKPT